MKKKVFPIIIFFACLTALIYLLSGIMLPKKNLAAYGMEEERANGILGLKEDTVDVLLIGNSLSYSDFTPLQLWKEEGYTSYTCGSNEQPLDYSLEMLRRTLKSQHPKIVILESESFFHEISTSSAFLAEISRIIPFFRYHDRWKNLGLYDFIPPFTTEICYTSKYMGFHFLEDTRPSPREDVEKHMKDTGDGRKIPRWNRFYADRIADMCRENGLKLVIVSMPNTKTWDMKQHKGVEVFAKEHGCEYIDLNLCNDEVGIDWQADTCDKGEHMNYTGAMKVTGFLTGCLKQTGLLSDHRSDPRYSDWDKHLRKYEKYLRKKNLPLPAASA